MAGLGRIMPSNFDEYGKDVASIAASER